MTDNRRQRKGLGRIYTMKTIAIIPARGGSKRLPRKNIMPLDGKPLLGHTIEQARRSGVFDHIFVSTEDDEIAAVAQEFGATLHRRDTELASDQARVRDVCLAVLEQCFDDAAGEVESFAVLTATSALRTAEDIRACHDLLRRGRDFVTSITDYFFYPHAAMTVDAQGGPSYHWPDIACSKGQDVPQLVVHNGAISWCRVKAFLAGRELLGPNAVVYPMPRSRSLDVDTSEDFYVMEAIWEKMKRRG